MAILIVTENYLEFGLETGERCSNSFLTNDPVSHNQIRLLLAPDSESL